MDEPEDRGPRYRLVMFIALAAIVVPGYFLLGWLGDNGVGNLFRSLLGLDPAKPRYTRTVTPATSPTSPPLAIGTPVTETRAVPTATPVSPLQTVAPPTATPHAPAATATSRPTQPPPTSTPPPPPPPPTATPTPRPAPTFTPTREPTLGYGTSVPAYGGAAVIRARPQTESDAIGSIPLGERVLVFRILEGEAIDPVESRWWDVEYLGVRGYVYYKLIRLN